jgi:hypothetical protein
MPRSRGSPDWRSSGFALLHAALVGWRGPTWRRTSAPFEGRIIDEVILEGNR